MSREVLLSEITDTLSRIRETDSKNEKVAIASSFIRRVPADQLEDAVRLLIGQPIPVDMRSLGVQWADMSSIMGNLAQKNLFSESLTVRRVANAFREIAQVSGSGARQKKAAILRGLMIDASEEERRHLIGAITGDVRAGFSEGLMLDALAEMANIPVKDATEVLGTVGDIGRAAARLFGRDSSTVTKLQPFSPFRPMLAESAEDAKEALAALGGKAAAEYKLDGIRIQAHKKGDAVKLYSRRLTEVTNALPEIVEKVRAIKADECIIDGEVIAFKGKPLPFQEVMRRVTRETGVETEAKDTPTKLQLFDVIYLDGEDLTARTYSERAELLRNIATESLVVERKVVSGAKGADAFFKKSLKDGHEGLMLKSLDGRYELGKRSASWVKVKRHVTIDAVIIGAERGHGRRSRWYSNYHLGVRTPNGFAMIGKTFKGLTDEEFEMLTMRLTQLLLEEGREWTTVRPEIVVEVAFNEIQKSPTYPSGMALRFARVTRIRDDKTPDQATTLDELKAMYERQFGSKAKSLK